MPGTNAGTGEPLSFRCARCRRRRVVYIPRDGGTWGFVTLTGRTRKHGHHRGVRHDAVAREYRCGCGHVGWSRHRDLARLAK